MMLARRFTIVCLLVFVFGASLAILVAENSRAGYTQTSSFTHCDSFGRTACISPLYRR